MSYTVSTFYTDADRQRHAWGAPFIITASEFVGYKATARALVEGLLEKGDADGSQSVGLEIIDPTGRLVFTYVRPAPSRE